MSIGILYECHEWSAEILNKYINDLGVKCELIDLQEDLTTKEILEHELLICRVFASGQFRGHEKALERMKEIAKEAIKRNIPMINRAESYKYEIDKVLVVNTLKKNGYPTPEILEKVEFPCILKPRCGGRTTYTFVARDPGEYEKIELPSCEMITEEYITPVKGYLDRLEFIGGKVFSVMKRTTTSDGLSAYHLGSKYYHYPDCPKVILETGEAVMETFGLECGSLDIIETDKGFYIIDVNNMSNASEDNIEDFGFDLMFEIAKYAVEKYNRIFH